MNMHTQCIYTTGEYQPYTGWQARSWGEVVMKSNTASSIIEQSCVYSIVIKRI